MALESADAAPSPRAPSSPTRTGRMLRVEFKGQPYDWFSLDDMGSLIQSEEFASTLKENINHYFNVPFDDQAVFDEEGILVSPIDFKRALQHPRPYFRVYNLRELPNEMKEQAVEKLATISQEVAKMQQALGTPASLGQQGFGRLSYGQVPGTYPAPAEPVQTQSKFEPCAPLAAEGLSVSSWPRGQETAQAAQFPAVVPGPSGCQKCGEPYEEGALFCRKCGQLRPTTPSELRSLPALPAVTTSSLADRLAGAGAALVGQAVPCNTGACQVATGPAPVPAQPLASLTGLPRPTAPNGKVVAPPAPPLIEVVLNKDTHRPAAACSVCGNMFMPDSEFCRKCGAKRDMSVVLDRFGFANVPGQDGRSLQVTWIDPEGLLARWNLQHADNQVHEGDYILSVNDFSEDVEAMRAQLQLKSIKMSLKAGDEPVQPEMEYLEEGTRLVLPQELASGRRPEPNIPGYMPGRSSVARANPGFR